MHTLQLWQNLILEINKIYLHVCLQYDLSIRKYTESFRNIIVLGL